MSKEIINTKFGIARLDKKKGYYKVDGKLLHRLIYENYHKVTLLSTTDIHHIDENRTNNEISNLLAISHGNHRKLHGVSEETRQKLRESNSGENNPFYGKKHSKEAKQKMRETKLGRKVPLETRINRGKTVTSTGILYVRKQYGSHLTQGFTWVYDDKKKVLTSIDLLKLKDRIRFNNLQWIVLDENKARDCFIENKENRIKYPSKKIVSEETKEKLRQINLGKTHSKDTKLKMSKSRGTSGVYYVSKENDKRYSQGFRWKYTYTGEDGKTHKLCSVDIEKLKKKVLDKCLEWIEY